MHAEPYYVSEEFLSAFMINSAKDLSDIFGHI